MIIPRGLTRRLLKGLEGNSAGLYAVAKVGRRLVHKQGMVDRLWHLRNQLHLRRSSTIKVGFGLLNSLWEGEFTLGVRKYRIDPIIDELNRTSKYSAGMIFRPEQAADFDVIIIVKLFDAISAEGVRAWQAAGKRVVYDIVDNPCNFRPTISYREDPEFIGMVDAVICSSPVQIEDIGACARRAPLIPHPVINSVRKHNYSSRDGVLRLIWQGHAHNIAGRDWLCSAVEAARAQTGLDIRLVFHTNAANGRDGFVETRRWNIVDWQDVLAEMDIGVVVKDNNDPDQYRKPSNKVLSYIAAGLPLICTPSPADMLVVEEGKNALIARDASTWREAVLRLVSDPTLREQLGRAALATAADHSPTRVAEQYVALLDSL